MKSQTLEQSKRVICSNYFIVYIHTDVLCEYMKFLSEEGNICYVQKFVRQKFVFADMPCMMGILAVKELVQF
jgi:hypothetical protein